MSVDYDERASAIIEHYEAFSGLASELRAYIAAELRAAHDAGVAEGKRKCAEEVRVFLALDFMVPEDVAAFLRALPDRWERSREADPGGASMAPPGVGERGGA